MVRRISAVQPCAAFSPLQQGCAAKVAHHYLRSTIVEKGSLGVTLLAVWGIHSAGGTAAFKEPGQRLHTATGQQLPMASAALDNLRPCVARGTS